LTAPSALSAQSMSSVDSPGAPTVTATSPRRRRRVGVTDARVSGLTTAFINRSRQSVMPFEADDRLGEAPTLVR
jgi:hypothetical protein